MNYLLALLLFLTTAVLADNEPIRFDLRLMASDLVDELVYDWTQTPPVNSKVNMVLTELSAPVGINANFNTIIENRFYELLRENPQLPLTLVYCSICKQFFTISNNNETYIGRGIDQPQILAKFLSDSAADYGLSLHFEAEGRDLVLRAILYSLRDNQKIVWAKAYNSKLSSRRVLRKPYPLRR